MQSFVYFNNQLLPATQPLVTAGNRGLRYGEGLFETIRMQNGQLCLADDHFNRLFNGMALLQWTQPASLTRAALVAQIHDLCHQNNLADKARIRLAVLGGEGALHEAGVPDVLVEALPFPVEYETFNEKGWQIGVYPHARKSCDALANLKSNNYLPYVLAARYARNQHWNDCLVLNSHDRVADTGIANIWCVKNDRIYTPPLREGGVDGVMRRHLLNLPDGRLTTGNITYHLTEKVLTPEELALADEVFLTNALARIRWIQQFEQTTYNNQVSRQLYNLLQKTAG